MNTLAKSPGKSVAMPSLRSLMEDFWNSESIFDRSFFKNQALPAVNIRESDTNFEIEVAAPGYKKDDFKIEVSDGVLTISAEEKEEKSEKAENYTRQEFSSSSFSRSFGLPENVNEEQVQARYKDGLLQLQLQKTEKAEPKKKMISVE